MAEDSMTKSPSVPFSKRMLLDENADDGIPVKKYSKRTKREGEVTDDSPIECSGICHHNTICRERMQVLLSDVVDLERKLDNLKRENHELQITNNEHAKTMSIQRDMNIKHQGIILNLVNEIDKKKTLVSKKSLEISSLKKHIFTLEHKNKPEEMASRRIENMVGSFVTLNRELYEWKTRALAAEKDLKERLGIHEENQILKRALAETEGKDRRMRSSVSELNKKVTELKTDYRELANKVGHDDDVDMESDGQKSEPIKRVTVENDCYKVHVLDLRVRRPKSAQTTPKRCRDTPPKQDSSTPEQEVNYSSGKRKRKESRVILHSPK
jgi:hypothetical protein